jgi:hypothetical protein
MRIASCACAIDATFLFSTSCASAHGDAPFRRGLDGPFPGACAFCIDETLIFNASCASAHTKTRVASCACVFAIDATFILSASCASDASFGRGLETGIENGLVDGARVRAGGGAICNWRSGLDDGANIFVSARLRFNGGGAPFMSTGSLLPFTGTSGAVARARSF